MTLAMRDLENQEIGKDKRDREKIEMMLKKGNYPASLVKAVQESLLVTQ